MANLEKQKTKKQKKKPVHTEIYQVFFQEKVQP